MNPPAAIKATFSDWRTVKSRKQLQLIFEVPLEQQSEVLEMLGAPMPHDPKWFGIARLANVASLKEHKERRRWDELALAMQASLRCRDQAFRAFLCERYQYVKDEEEAAIFVRQWCGVKSRAGINDNPKAAAKWVSLDSEYQVWLRVPA